MFYDVLNWDGLCFEDAEKTLEGLNDNQIDEVLLAIYNRYKEPLKKVINGLAFDEFLFNCIPWFEFSI